MTKQLDSVEATKPEHEPTTVLNAESEKRIDQLAEEVAEKGSRTEQKYDNDHQIFSK
jgi:hypothetical protein